MNGHYFTKDQLIIVHNKNIFNTVDMNTVFMKCGILLNISSLIYFHYSLCLIGKKTRREYYLYIMPENYRTIGIYQLSLLASHALKTVLCVVKTIPTFNKLPMILSLYYSTIYYT